MSRNFQACWTCRIRRKGGCQGPGPSGDCSRCIDLNVECLKGYGERVPKHYRRPEIIEELSRWNRRKSSRRAPDKLLLGPLVQRLILEQEATTSGSADASQSMIVISSPTISTSSSVEPPSHHPSAPQSSQADVVVGSVYLSSVSAFDLSNPSPTISTTSSPLQSTLSSVHSNSVQNSPSYSTASLKSTRDMLAAQAVQSQLPTASQVDLLSEIASDYSSYVSMFTPSPELSTVPRPQLEADLVTSAFVDMQSSGSNLGSNARRYSEPRLSSIEHSTSNTHNPPSTSRTMPPFSTAPQQQSSPMFRPRHSQNQPTAPALAPFYPMQNTWGLGNMFEDDSRSVTVSERIVPSHPMYLAAEVPPSSSWHPNVPTTWPPSAVMHHATSSPASIPHLGSPNIPLANREVTYASNTRESDQSHAQRGSNTQVNLEMATAQYRLIQQSRGGYFSLTSQNVTNADDASQLQQGNFRHHFPVQTQSDVIGSSRPNEAPQQWTNSNGYPRGS